MGMSIDEVIKKYKNQAEWEHSHNNMDYCEEYEQLAKWLEQLQKIKEIAEKWKADNFTDGFAWDCMQEVADIIDKAESEGADV